jgi:hypothetical protein
MEDPHAGTKWPGILLPAGTCAMELMRLGVLGFVGPWVLVSPKPPVEVPSSSCDTVGCHSG